MAQTLESRSLWELYLLEPETALQSIRENIGDCCSQEIFADTVQRMRASCDAEVDMALNLMPLLSRFPAGQSARLLSQIMEQFFKDADRSQFGLANAITAVARDTPDPDLRWDLEELGGGIAVGQFPRRPRVEGWRETRRSPERVAVG